LPEVLVARPTIAAPSPDAAYASLFAPPERAEILHAGAGGPAERARIGAEPGELTDNDLPVSGDTPRLAL
jgi:hypothetical protein